MVKWWNVPQCGVIPLFLSWQRNSTQYATLPIGKGYNPIMPSRQGKSNESNR